MKTQEEVLQWIKDKLSTFILDATTGTIFTEDWLAGIVARETTNLIIKYVNLGKSFDEICSLMKGDFTDGIYHGFSFFQIDVRSFPDFITSGLWINPQASAKKAVEVLNGKYKYLFPYKKNMTDDQFNRAVTAAYNCGEGNVKRAIVAGFDVDHYTTHANYSKNVWDFRDIYRNLKQVV